MLFSGKNYTAGTNFTRSLVMTVATNLNSAYIMCSYHFLQYFGQIGRKSTLMITLTTMTIGGSFPYVLHPTPDLYPLLVISRWKLWKTTIFIKISKVCLWFRPRRHLHEHLQSCDRKRRRLSSNAFWNFDRGSIFCRWSGGLLAVTGEQIVLATRISRNTALGLTEVQC